LYRKSALLAAPYHYHLHRNYSAILKVLVLSCHFILSL
jgi:hypothetical protein